MLFLVFFFSWGIISFELTSLPRFKHDLDLFVLILLNHPIGTSIYVGVFTLVTFLALVNASSSWFIIFCMWIIFWTFNSFCFVWGSRWPKPMHFKNLLFSSPFETNFTPPKDGKIVSSKLQLTKHFIKASPIWGFKYWIIDGELKPI